jgi:catalase
MKDSHRKNLVENIVGHLKGADKAIQQRQVGIFIKCDQDYGIQVAKGLGLPSTMFSKF